MWYILMSSSSRTSIGTIFMVRGYGRAARGSKMDQCIIIDLKPYSFSTSQFLLDLST